MSSRRKPSHLRVRAPVAALLCLLASGCSLLPASVATPASAVGRPTSTVPASARPQNGLDATSAVSPSTAGGASAPAEGATTATSTTPTTTYAPAAPTGTSQPSTTPSTTPSATPSAATGTPTVGGATAPAARPATPASARTTAKKGDRPLSTGAIVIAALAALLVLACAAWGLARLTAYEPHWLISLRHSLAEAGFRVSATWSEFTDWARLGH